MTQPDSKRLVTEARFTAISNAATAAAQSQIDASAASAAASAASAAQAVATATAPTDTAVAATIGTTGSQSRGAVISAAANPGIAPLYVDTIAGVAKTQVGAANARTGFVQASPGTDSGWDQEMAIAVTGVKGSYTLTSTDTANVSGLGTTLFDVVVTNTSDGVAQFNVFLSQSGGTTITLLRPLKSDVTGFLASRADVASGGQHMTAAGFRGLAQVVANETALYGQRGKIIAGTWDLQPPAYQTTWALNAATVAYGESNSTDGGTVVRTYMVTQATANVTNFDGVAQRRTRDPGGVQVGTHLAGHGATGTLYTGRRDAVLEFWTTSYRDITTTQVARKIRIVVKGDGNTLSDETIDGFSHRVRVALTGVDKVTIDVTNVDGAPSYLHLSQCRLREPGAGAIRPLVGKKIVCLGDSWFAWYNGAFATELARVTGSTVINHAKGGMTTDWGLSWFDTYVLAEKPDVCVINFYTNDLNNLQSQTFVDPTGATVSRWPNGLTQAQCQARWRSQMLLLIKRCQDAGIKPVVLLPGGANFTNQWPASATFEQPPLLDWSATAAELADPVSYVNTVGKTTGAQVKLGTAVRFAAGPLATDSWGNVNEDAVAALQKKTLKRSDYAVSTGVIIGTDTNSDGLSDGFVNMDYGTQTGDVYTPSLVGGNQRMAYTYAASGASGNRRLRVNFAATSGQEYLVLFDVINGLASGSMTDSYSDLTGVATVFTANGSTVLDATGAGVVTYRAVANATATKYAAVALPRTNGATRSFDVRKVYVTNLTSLFVDAPNLKNMTLSQLSSFVMSLQP